MFEGVASPLTSTNFGLQAPTHILSFSLTLAQQLKQLDEQHNDVHVELVCCKCIHVNCELHRSECIAAPFNWGTTDAKLCIIHNIEAEDEHHTKRDEWGSQIWCNEKVGNWQHKHAKEKRTKKAHHVHSKSSEVVLSVHSINCQDG